MRLSTVLLVVTTSLTAGCLGEVGPSRKPPGAGSGSGSDAPVTMVPPTTACAKIEKTVTIRVPADMELLPRTGCYDIVGKLLIQSAQITSLAALKDLSSVSELEVDYSGLATLDFKLPVNLYGALTITNNPVLRDLKMVQLATPPENVVIDNNLGLTSLDALVSTTAKLTEVNGDLEITNNPALTAIALPSLTKVTGLLIIGSNDKIASVDLSQLVTTHGLDVADNAQLVSVAGLAATEIAGDLAIRSNPKLTTIGTMGALATVTGNVIIDSNAALPDLKAFTLSMKRIGRTLTINNNAALADLGMLKHLDLIGSLTITNNHNLVGCRVLEVDRCVAHNTASQLSNNRDGNCNSSCD
ncbi:MAG: hypothetical protein ABIY55_29755 [Kofleriaceae bacterium]